MQTIRLLALDLDGTLLNSRKELTPRTKAALCAAAEAGVEIVPTTGRIFCGMPQAVRELPFLHYAVAINGAQVYDIGRDCTIRRAELDTARALRILQLLDTFPAIYDCYMDNWGWMTRTMYDAAADYVPNPRALEMVKRLRTPVDDLKSHIRAAGHGIQKIQLFTPDAALRAHAFACLRALNEQLSVSSAAPFNIEINDQHANKGEALAALTEHLGIGMDEVMAIGDGLNDLSMLRMAGLGVAMGNACPEALDAADTVTAPCDDEGAAQAIERFCCGRTA